MSVHQMILNALDGLAPIEAETYTGDAEIYYVFNYSTLGAAYANDMPTCERYLVQVHLFAPIGTNSLRLRRLTKSRLAAAGFTWPEEISAGSSTSRTDAQAEGQHYVFECETVEGIHNGDA